jgi:hypothetical protein
MKFSSSFHTWKLRLSYYGQKTITQKGDFSKYNISVRKFKIINVTKYGIAYKGKIYIGV